MVKVIWRIKRRGKRLKKKKELRKEYRCKWCKKKFKCQIMGSWNPDIGPICARCYVDEKYRRKKKKKKRKVKFALK